MVAYILPWKPPDGTFRVEAVAANKGSSRRIFLVGGSLAGPAGSARAGTPLFTFLMEHARAYHAGGDDRRSAARTPERQARDAATARAPSARRPPSSLTDMVGMDLDDY